MKKWINVVGTREGFFILGQDWNYLWEDDRIGESLCKLYGHDPDSTKYFETDLMVRKNDGSFKGNPAYNPVPWIILTPEYEDVVDGVSMGQVFHAHELVEGHLGVVTLCWEGLIEHFGATDVGSLAVYPANFGRLPRNSYEIERDYNDR